MTLLPKAFLTVPVAHRAYHDREKRCPENSRAAFLAAIETGYGIECDVQLSADNRAIVFHDYKLDRLTPETGRVRACTADQLAHIPLTDSGETVPTLVEMLDLVGGRTPLLIEIKDQDGLMGQNVGALEAAVADDIKGYDGPLAVMSFNPHSVAAFGALAPDIPRGLTTSAYDPEVWLNLPAETCERLRDIPDYDRIGATFISHEASDLARPRVADLKAEGAGVLCWTIRSAVEEAQARQIADNITFEGYAARLTAAD